VFCYPKKLQSRPALFKRFHLARALARLLAGKALKVNFLQAIIWDISNEVAPVFEVAHRGLVTLNLLCFKVKIGLPASIHKNVMLVLGKSFSLCFTQHHDCIIDAEAIGSRLVPNAFARFR
jgi:hypothetical protein